MAVEPDSLNEILVAWTLLDTVRVAERAVDALHDLRVRRRQALPDDPFIAKCLLEVEEIIATELIPSVWPLYMHKIEAATRLTQRVEERSSGQSASEAG